MTGEQENNTFNPRKTFDNDSQKKKNQNFFESFWTGIGVFMRLWSQSIGVFSFQGAEIMPKKKLRALEVNGARMKQFGLFSSSPLKATEVDRTSETTTNQKLARPRRKETTQSQKPGKKYKKNGAKINKKKQQKGKKKERSPPCFSISP